MLLKHDCYSHASWGRRLALPRVQSLHVETSLLQPCFMGKKASAALCLEATCC